MLPERSFETRRRMLARLLLGAMAPYSPMPPELACLSSATTPGRVAWISQLLRSERLPPLPGSRLDVHYSEERTGDGRAGPAGVEAICSLALDPSHVPVGRAALSKSNTLNCFSSDADSMRAAPRKAQSWWVREEGFGALECSSPVPFTGYSNG